MLRLNFVDDSKVVQWLARLPHSEDVFGLTQPVNTPAWVSNRSSGFPPQLKGMQMKSNWLL